MPVKNMLKLGESVKMMKKKLSDGTTYSLYAEIVGTFEILCVVSSVASVFFISL
jgi:hypothetical protein